MAKKTNPRARLDERFAPVRARIAELGETEDDVVEYLEQIKHELRAEEQAEL